MQLSAGRFSPSAPHPGADPVVEGGDHLIEIDLLVAEVADVAALEDIQPDRPDVEIVVSGDPKDHVLLLVAEDAVDLALDDAVGLAGSVHLDVHLDHVPAIVHEVAAVTDPAHGVVRYGLAAAALPRGSPEGIAVPVAGMPGEAAV